MFELEELKSGVKLATSFMNDTNSVAVGVFVKVGSRDEPNSKKGLSHFFEHMVFKGTKRFSCKKIKISIEGVGGYLNAFTSKEVTCFYAKVPSNYQNKTLEILLDMTQNPLLREEDLEKERKVIFEEIKMHIDLPSSYVFSLNEKEIFKGSSLEADIIGDFETVSRIEREDLLKHKEKFYTPSNMVISVAGNLNKKEIKEFLMDKIKRERKKSVRFKKEEFKNKKSLVLEKREINQVHLIISFLGLSRLNPQRFLQEMLHVILGANMSSRLFEKIREKRGLVYEVSSFTRKYKDIGLFGIHLATAPQKVTKAIDLVLKELENIKSDIKDSEIKRAKDYLWGNFLIGLDSISERMLYMGDSVVYENRIPTLDEIKKKIDGITLEDVKKFSKDIFDLDKVVFTLLGNIDETELKDYFKKVKIDIPIK